MVAFRFVQERVAGDCLPPSQHTMTVQHLAEMYDQGF
jgi:hypothetical protein